MKRFILVGAVLAGCGFGYHKYTERKAIEAVVASVCAEELNDAAMQNVAVSRAAMAGGASDGVGAALAYQRKTIYERSSLAPHLAALARSGDPSVARIKEVAKVVAARCPDVFPEPIKAEKPLASVWLMAVGVRDLDT
ncbi:MAG: hypothetical protein JNK82_39915 [Myxococcaceae bacterium]|nr:hypothetical protein [Myxococcaceae bacterium]